MTIMITGGTGFLGTYLTHYLVRQCEVDERVVVFDRQRDYRWPWDTRDRVISVVGDVLEIHELLAAMERHDVDRVVHLAFAVGRPSPDRTIPFVRLECMGTANVYEAARMHGVERIVLGSSIAAYGAHNVDELTEDLPATPDAIYGACKVMNEQLATHYSATHGMTAVNLRFGSIFGLGRSNRGSYGSGLLSPIADFRANVERAVAGFPVDMPVESDRITNFCYAFDAAQAMWLALTAPSPTYALYNVTGPPRRLSDFAACVRTLLPDAQLRSSDDVGVVHQLMSTQRIESDLGYTPRYTMEQGLEDYVQRARAALAV